MKLLRERYYNLQILSFENEAERNALRFLLSDVPQDLFQLFSDLKKESFVLPGHFSLRPAAYRIIQLLNLHEVKSVIVEADYVDRNFSRAYIHSYSRIFKDQPRRTIRLHFFREKLTSFTVLLDEKKLQKSYIGFCVIHPIQRGIIGRTVLPPPSERESPCSFVTCQSHFSVNLSGAQLKAKGVVFVQQDGRVAACATAAAWIAVKQLTKYFELGLSVPSESEITQAATRHLLVPRWGSGPPGLTIEQMLLALREMGLEPVSHEAEAYKNPEELKTIIYGYVESGIPPILLLELKNGHHAVVAVGHTYSPFHARENFVSPKYHLSTEWCPAFLVHDDQMGLYIKLKIKQNSKRKLKVFLDESDFLAQNKMLRKWYKDATLIGAIVPLPRPITLTPEKAIEKARSVFEIAFEAAGRDYPLEPVYRIFLVPSNRFKRGLIPSKVKGLSLELVHWYRSTVYPRYIWVVELSTKDLWDKKDPDKLSVIGEITMDPASPPDSFDFVTLHLPHLFLRIPPGERRHPKEILRNLEFNYIIDDQPHQSFQLPRG